MEITRSIVIDRSREEVFAYVADARNDPHWCPKVVSTELADSDGLYAVVHKPIPGRPAREMSMTCRSQEPPARIEWYEDDGSDTFQVTYTLEDVNGSTRFTQQSIASLSTSRLLAPVMRHGIGRDIDKQLKRLKATLEAHAPSS
jgi:uncharacterized protein YndB with AHSA1/START domain